MSHNTNLSISGNTAQCNARQLFSLLQVGTIRTINLFSDGLGKSEIADFLELEENKKFNLPETHEYLRKKRLQARVIDSKPSSCQHNGLCWLGLNRVKDEIDNLKTHERGPSVLGQLIPEDFSTVKQWMGSKDYQILLVVSEPGNVTWTTTLLLEILDLQLATKYNPTITFAAHMCNLYHTETKERQVRLLVETLLDLLVESYPEIFDDIHTCQQRITTKQEPDIEVNQLWGLLTKYVQDSGTKKLIIIINQIHCLFPKRCNEIQYPFIKMLETFCEDLKKVGIIVKVLAISLEDNVADFFEPIKNLRVITLAEAPSCYFSGNECDGA